MGLTAHFAAEKLNGGDEISKYSSERLADIKSQKAKKKLLFVTLVVLGLSIVGFAIFGFIQSFLQNDDSKSLVDKLMDNFWSVIDMLLLLVAVSLPMYLKIVERDERMEREGDFANRILISLNVVKPPRIPGLKGEFFIRTIVEDDFGSYFPDLYIQKILNDAKRKHNPNLYPFIQVQTNDADWKRLRDHIKNKISSLSGQGHIMQDVEIPTVEVRYVWALTYEVSDHRDELNNKFRILLIQEDFLDKVDCVDYDEVYPKNKLDDRQAEIYFENRWKYLQMLKALFPRRRLDGLLADAVSLTLPAPAKSAGHLAPTVVWDSWKGVSKNAITLERLDSGEIPNELYIDMK